MSNGNGANGNTWLIRTVVGVLVTLGVFLATFSLRHVYAEMGCIKRQVHEIESRERERNAAVSAALARIETKVDLLREEVGRDK